MTGTLSKLILISLLTGCTGLHPYVEATHTSNPSIDKDGYNDVCGGGIYLRGNFQTKAGVCNNVTGYRGTRADLSIMWIIKDE